MSHVNASVEAVDKAIDMLEMYEKELLDVRARVIFDITSLFDLVEREISICIAKINSLSYICGNSYRLYRLREQLNVLYILRGECSNYGKLLLEEWKRNCEACDELKKQGVGRMGEYIRKLNLVAGHTGKSSTDGVYVCVVDSSAYPQTAEHIKAAQNSGRPAVLTVDRKGASYRRKHSLYGKKTRSIYDRDEYPCAMFKEGGKGASVVYVDRKDNRGAGASVRWQTRHLPDGSRVRIRVI